MTSKFSKATVTHHYSNSLYLQDMVEFNEQWKVLAALRYDFFRYMSASATTPTGRREYEEHSSFNMIKNKALTYRSERSICPSEYIHLCFFRFFLQTDPYVLSR